MFYIPRDSSSHPVSIEMRFFFICCGIALVLLVVFQLLVFANDNERANVVVMPIVVVLSRDKTTASHVRMPRWLPNTILNSFNEKNKETTNAEDRLELVSLVNSLLKHLLQIEGMPLDEKPEEEYLIYEEHNKVEGDPPERKLGKKQNKTACNNSTVSKNRPDFINHGNSSDSPKQDCQPIIPEKPEDDSHSMTEDKPPGSNSQEPNKEDNNKKVDDPSNEQRVCVTCCEICKDCSGEREMSNGYDKCAINCKISCEETFAVIRNGECNIGKQPCKDSVCNGCCCYEKNNAFDTQCNGFQQANQIDCRDICNTGCNTCNSQALKCKTLNNENDCIPSCQPTCNGNHGDFYHRCQDQEFKCQSSDQCAENRRIWDQPGTNGCQQICHPNCGNKCFSGCNNRCQTSKHPTFNTDHCSPSYCCGDFSVCHQQSKFPACNMSKEGFGTFQSDYDSVTDYKKNYDEFCNPASNSWGHTKPIPEYPKSACCNVPCKHLVPSECQACNKAGMKCFANPASSCIHPVATCCQKPCMPSCCQKPCMPSCCEKPCMSPSCRTPCMSPCFQKPCMPPCCQTSCRLPCCQKPCMQPCCQAPCMPPCCQQSCMPSCCRQPCMLPCCQPCNQRVCCNTPCMTGRYPICRSWNICCRCYFPQCEMNYYKGYCKYYC